MERDLSIRLAAASEREALVALQWRASLANDGDREALLAHPDAIDLPAEQIDAGQVFVAVEEGVIVGFATVLRRDDGDTELDGLFVEPEVWKGGIGWLLVDRSADYAREHGAKALHVIGNPHAEGFYVACGFQAIGNEDTRFGSGMIMKLPV